MDFANFLDLKSNLKQIELPGDRAHLLLVPPGRLKKIKDHLEYGNAYQINYTMLKKFEVSISPFELYLQLRKNIKPKFGYYLKNDQGSWRLSLNE